MPNNTLSSPCAQRFKHDRAAAYFMTIKAGEGFEVSKWKWTLNSPGSMPPHAMIQMAKDLQCDMGDLLAAGFGRLNKYDDIDAAVSAAGTGERLGTVQHIC